MKEIIIKSYSDEGKGIVQKFKRMTTNVCEYAGYRLYGCNAFVRIRYGAIILYSYQTPIAVLDTENKICYECLRPIYGYTSTSNQHISKFKKYLIEKIPQLYDELTFYSVR